MKKFIQKICSDLVKQYKPDKNILGILLFGSVVRNKFDQYSDIDIYILLKKKTDYSRLNFVKNNMRIDIILDTVGEASSFLKNDKYNIKRNTSHMLANSKILYQAGNDLNKIIAKAKNNLRLRTKYNNDEILMHKYSIDDFWGEVQRDFKNHNLVAFELDSHLLMKNIIELFLKIKGDFLRQPNEVADIIGKRDKKLGYYIEKFYKARDLKNKLIILPKIINHIYELSNGPLPQKWQIK
ncbi:MAG: nucleotidyltransferase domain-containing protein [Patescibacteria group bacterium]|jgi:predicted nucleotidyltransferase